MNHRLKNIKIAVTSTVLFAMAILMLMSCGKDIEKFTQYIVGDIQQFSTAVQTLEESFQANSDEDIFHISESGRTLMYIPANSLRTEDGEIYSGQVIIEFLEIQDKGVMVLYQKPTVTEDALLESAGEFYIDVRGISGETLYPGEDGYRLFIKEDNPDEAMKLFYGEETADGEFVWAEADSTSDWGIVIGEWGFPENQFFGFGYEVVLDQFNWINCDRFSDIPSELKTNVCVELPEIYTNTNTIVFIIFTDDNSVVGLYGNPEKMQFCSPGAFLPIGYNVTFVAISDQDLDNDRFHFGMKNAVLEENHFENIFLEEKSLNEILDILGMF